MSAKDMEKYSYVVNIPDGPGGDSVTHEGALANCERCAQPFQVSAKKDVDECFYHWGKPFSKVVNGKVCSVRLNR
jgi:RNA exonuclease 1